MVRDPTCDRWWQARKGADAPTYHGPWPHYGP